MSGDNWLVYKFGGGGESNCEAFEMTPDVFALCVTAVVIVLTCAFYLWLGKKVKKGEG